MDLPRDNDLVYVPASPNANHDGVDIEARRLAESGEPVGLAFTSPEVLARHLGKCQPWISMPMRDYARFLRHAGIGRVQIDPAPGSELWRWDDAALAARAERRAG